MEPTLLQVLRGHSKEVNACHFGPKNLLATASSDATIIIWKWNNDDNSFQKEKVLKQHTLGVNDVRFSSQGTILASVSSDSSIIVWDLVTFTPLCSLIHPSNQSLRVCRFSPDSTQLLTGGDDGTVCIWDVASRTLKRILQIPDEGAIYAADFSPDGALILTGSGNGKLYVWDGHRSVHSRYIAMFEEAHDMAVLSSEFVKTIEEKSASEKIYRFATAGIDGLVRLWNIILSGVNGVYMIVPDKTIGCHSQSVLAVRFSPSDNYLAVTGGNKTICIYDTKSVHAYQNLRHHERHVGACSFSRNGALLATGSNDRTVAIWKTGLGENISGCRTLSEITEQSHRLTMIAVKNEAVLKQSIVSHTSDINHLIFLSDNLLISCGNDKTVKSFTRADESDTWSESREISSERYSVTSATFEPKLNFMATACLDGNVTIWSPGNEHFHKMAKFKCPKNCSIRVCSFSPSNNWLAAGGDGESVYLWDVYTMTLAKTFIGHEAAIFMTSFTFDARFLVTGCKNGELKLWPVESQGCRSLAEVREAHDLGVTCGKCSNSPCVDDESSTLIVTGGNDGLVKVWKFSLTKTKIIFVRTLQGHGSSVMSVEFSSDGNLLASTSGDKTLRLWDTQTWNCLRLMEGHSRYVTTCAFSPCGKYLATGSNDKLINIWILTGRLAPPYLAQGSQTEKVEVEVPHEFICPITHEVFENPVRCSDGFVYEEASIREWLTSRRKSSPLTNLPLVNTELVPQEELKQRIKIFLASQEYL